MKILIVDPVTPKPYDPNTLLTEPMGGTEATVIRIAEALASRGHQVRVTQHNRTEDMQFNARYCAPADNSDFKPTHVVVLRAPLVLKTAKQKYPQAKLYLWCHDMFGGDGWVEGFKALAETNAVPIVVSEWHRTQMYEVLKSLNLGIALPCKRLYNPIADDLKPQGTPVDNDKLVFFSSPHKGLDNTLKVFEQFKEFPDLADMKLYIANPGYFPDHETKGLRNVVNLGPLTHAGVLDHVRSSLAVLHLNAVFPETMGIVHAEANAVGTPFLSSKLGATPEIADHPAQLLNDVKDVKSVVERITQWKVLSRPRVRAMAHLRMSRVIREWEELLGLE